MLIFGVLEDNQLTVDVEIYLWELELIVFTNIDIMSFLI